MANSNEIAQIDEIYKKLTSLDSSLNTMAANYLKMIQILEGGNKTVKDTTVNYENLNKTKKESIEVDKQKDALNKQLAATEQKLLTFDAAIYEQIQKNNKALSDQKKAINDKVKASDAEEGSLVRLRQKLTELTSQYDKTGTRTKAATDEINKLSREIGKAEEATNRHQRGVGGYADQLGKLPGPAGAAASAASSFGATLWALVANPVGAAIAAIVAVFAALGSVFSSTASGGKIIKEVMASLGAVLDVLIQRTVIVIDAFKALFSGEWKKAGDLFSDSVSGIGKQMGEASKEAKNLTDRQLELNKELAFHLSEEANEENQIQKLIFLAKDRTKTDAERLGYMREAMALSKEKAEREEFYAKTQYDLDVANAVLKAKITGVTEDQLKSFIELNAKEQMSALDTSNALKGLYNILGKDGIAALEESNAKVTEANTKFFQENKRNESLMSGFVLSIETDRKKAAEESLKKKISELELSSAQEKIEINKRHIDGITSTEKYQAELLAEEMKFLDKKQALYKKDSKEWLDVETEKQGKQIKINDDLLKVAKDKNDYENQLGEEANRDLEKLLDDQYNYDEKIKKEQFELTKKYDDEKFKTEKDTSKKIRDIQLQMGKEAINAIFDMNNQKFAAELSALEKEKEAKLSNAKLTATQKANIEAEYAKKEAAIKTKQAQSDKLKALFDIAIGTAVGVATNLKTPLLIPWIIALGALEAAIVAARPIPKYAKGTMSAEKRGIFGEAGLEVMFPKSGGAIFADKPTYFDGDKFKGAKIYSNPETERIMSMVSDRNIIVKNQHDDRLLNEMKSVKDAIINKPLLIMNNEYQVIGQGTSSHQQVIINRLLRN